MAAPLDVCIRGAGIVGRTLALLLARERLRVGLVRGRAAGPRAHSDVRAYALNAASRELLMRCAPGPTTAHATPVLGMDVHGDEGGAGAASTRRRARAGAGLDRRRRSRCWRGWPRPCATSRRSSCCDAPRPAALTVVCEGRASATRAEFGVQFEVTPYPPARHRRPAAV